MKASNIMISTGTNAQNRLNLSENEGAVFVGYQRYSEYGKPEKAKISVIAVVVRTPTFTVVMEILKKKADITRYTIMHITIT